MAQTADYSERLKELSERAATSRRSLTRAGQSLQVASNLGQRVQNSIRGNSATWLGSAAVVGWILSKLPSRKKKIYINKATNTATNTTAEAAKSGLFLAVLGIVFKVVQPLLQKMLIEQVGILAEKHLGSRPGKTAGKI